MRVRRGFRISSSGWSCSNKRTTGQVLPRPPLPTSWTRRCLGRAAKATPDMTVTVINVRASTQAAAPGRPCKGTNGLGTESAMPPSPTLLHSTNRSFWRSLLLRAIGVNLTHPRCACARPWSAIPRIGPRLRMTGSGRLRPIAQFLGCMYLAKCSM